MRLDPSEREAVWGWPGNCRLTSINFPSVARFLPLELDNNGYKSTLPHPRWDASKRKIKALDCRGKNDEKSSTFSYYFHSVIYLTATHSFRLSMSRKFNKVFPVQSNVSSVSVSHTVGDNGAGGSPLSFCFGARGNRGDCHKAQGLLFLKAEKHFLLLLFEILHCLKLSTSTIPSLHIFAGVLVECFLSLLLYTFCYGFSSIFPSLENLFFMAVTTLRTRTNS